MVPWWAFSSLSCYEGFDSNAPSAVFNKSSMRWSLCCVRLLGSMLHNDGWHWIKNARHATCMLLITSAARRHHRCGEMKRQPVIVPFPDGSRVILLIEHRRWGSDCSLSITVWCGKYCTSLRVGFSFNLLCKRASECTDVPLCALLCAIFIRDYLMSKLSCAG